MHYILVVEDEPGIRNLIIRAIGRVAGRIVLEAASAAEATNLSAAFAGDIHLLIVDYGLGDMPGPHVAKRLLQTRPNMKVLYISGHPQEMLMASGIREHDFFLEKPFMIATLVDLVERILRAPSAATSQ